MEPLLTVRDRIGRIVFGVLCIRPALRLTVFVFRGSPWYGRKKCLGGRNRNVGRHVQGTNLELLGESRAIPIFLLTTLLTSSVFYFLIIKSDHMGGGWGAYVAGLMWSPGFAALLTSKFLRRDFG
jgi:hypothetical protein